MMQIPVPESISREAVMILLEQLGLDGSRLKSLTIHPTAIAAEVYGANADGARYHLGGDLGVAVHTVYIPIVDP